MKHDTSAPRNRLRLVVVINTIVLALIGACTGFPNATCIEATCFKMPLSSSLANLAAHRLQPPELHLVTDHDEPDARAASAAAVANALCQLFTKVSEPELASLLHSIEQGNASAAARLAHDILRPIAFPAHPAPAAMDVDVGVIRPLAPAKKAKAKALLSARELRVLWYVSRGWSNREIAETTHRSINTIEAQLKSLYRKLGVKSRTQAISEAMKHGLLSWRSSGGDPSAAMNDAEAGPVVLQA
ncbi:MULTISPECIES: LuxR C-terminal-related transcriptional regulator [unclassified Variovorax]|uniref:LuxR C-terminal-related transcriptional regulator n=1 Tax=unclassified Variovorax TaxID=663243 RepID=UPI000F7EF5CF|nr:MULTISPECIES: LuxR C-terminal-related transcriptional regulator [unclassified Variovorax]RSZ37231.1 response regulator transcription factor [Variovorax sp. 553]RSZ38045.1 response regulator transcription factor [Variovorax sp. 679]